MAIKNLFQACLIIFYSLEVTGISDSMNYEIRPTCISPLRTGIFCNGMDSGIQGSCHTKGANSNGNEYNGSILKISQILCRKENNSSLRKKTLSFSALQSLSQHNEISSTVVRGRSNPSSSEIEFVDLNISSLALLLKAIIGRYLSGCDLILLTSAEYMSLTLLDELSQLPNLKQVVDIETLQNPQEDVLWNDKRCHGTIIFHSDPDFLLDFGDNSDRAWNYGAKVVMAGLSRKNLELFMQTRKAKRTEHIIGIVKSKTEGQYDIYMNELFWGNRGLSRISTWRRDSFREGSEFDLFPDKTRDLKGAVLQVVVFEWPPSIIYHRDNDGNLLYRYGQDIEIGKALADVFNFTISYMESPQDENFGYPYPNGSYSGMVGYMDALQSDLAASNIWVAPADDRLTRHDFSSHYEIDNECVHLARDPPLPLWQSPGLPFKVVTWMAIFLGLLLAGPILYALVGASNKIETAYDSTQQLWTLSLYTFGVHFSHPMATLPKNSSTKIFVAFLWIYSIILTTGYRSNLTAFLTIAREPRSIETVKELYESGMKMVGFPYFKRSLEISETRYLKGLADRYEEMTVFAEQVKLIVAGEAGSVNGRIKIEMAVKQYTDSTGKPLTRVMKECFSYFSNIVAFQKNSPLKPRFNTIIMGMNESGLARQWLLNSLSLYNSLRKKAEKESALEVGSQVSRNVEGVIPLGLDHLQGIFIVWSFGSLISAIFFTLEILSSR